MFIKAIHGSLINVNQIAIVSIDRDDYYKGELVETVYLVTARLANGDAVMLCKSENRVDASDYLNNLGALIGVKELGND